MNTNDITKSIKQEYDQFHSLLGVCMVMSEKLSVIIRGQEETNTRLDRVETGQEETNQRLLRLEAGQERLEARQDQLEAGQKRLEENQQATYEILGDMAYAVSDKMLANKVHKKAKALKKALT